LAASASDFRYPEEVDARIERNEELHEAAEQALSKLRTSGSSWTRCGRR
jgi:hypothetical protein